MGTFQTVLRSGVRKVQEALAEMSSAKGRFTEYHKVNQWGGGESRSGTGSDLVQTARLRQELPMLLRHLGAKSMLDAPCGDFYWMKELQLPVDKYIGADIVPAVIELNNARYRTPKREFRRLDITKNRLPEVDVIFCRDCLVHLSYDLIFKALRNFKRSNSTCLLTTTFTDRSVNEDIQTGEWRPLNLQAEPFGFCAPLSVINEGCSENEGLYRDKSLGLWKLADLL